MIDASFSFHQIEDLKKILSKQEIYTGVYASPYGSAYLQTTPDYLLGLYFVDSERERIRIQETFAKKYGLESLKENNEILVQWGLRIFSSSETAIPLKIGGTDFQCSVWQHLSSIPRGTTTTYEKIAQALKNPRALRAVGSAVGANPISIVLPCHRVLRKDGSLGGYRWGIARKQQILDAEKS